MAPLELALPNALSIRTKALSVQKPPLPAIEAPWIASIQGPIMTGTHFTDPGGMEGLVDATDPGKISAMFETEPAATS